MLQVGRERCCARRTLGCRGLKRGNYICATGSMGEMETPGLHIGVGGGVDGEGEAFQQEYFGDGRGFEEADGLSFVDESA